ncbi:MAG: copper transporter, partial [Ornithinibacter sp.]
MIDFRYHLVSIVSIFMALAVGIVLGAGPLKGEIGNTLSKEVAGLRQDKADLNTQLQQANAGAEARDAYIGETNPDVLAGVLQDRRVALVVLPGSDASVSEATAATLRQAGASVVSTTSVSDTWVTTDESAASARDAAVREAATGAGIDVSDPGSVSMRDVLLAALLTAPTRDADAVAASTASAGLKVLSSAELLE